MIVAAAGGVLALFGAAIGLGARHAIEPDHLTVIDGVARRNVTDRLTFARLSGVLFGIGHGVIVLAAAVAAVLVEGACHLPAVIMQGGALLSVTIMLALGALNLRAAVSARPDQAVAMVGWKSRLIGTGGDHPLVIIGIGMLFALAFDTLSLAAVLGLAAARLGGMVAVITTVAAFTVGMAAIGGVNGLWMVAMVRSAGRRAAKASRLMTGVVGLLNLSVGLVASLVFIRPGAFAQTDNSSAWITVAVLAAGCLAYLLAIGRRAPRSRLLQASAAAL